MNFGRKSVIFAAQWIPIFLLLLFVAPHAPAQQEEKPSPAQATEPKPRSNPRDAANQPSTTRGDEKNSDARAARQRSRSPRDGSRQSATSNSNQERPSGNGRSSDTRIAQSTQSSTPESAANDPRSVRPPKAGQNSQQNARPSRSGPAAHAPGQSSSAPNVANDRASSTNRPVRSDSLTRGANLPGKTTNAEEKTVTGEGRRSAEGRRYSRTTRANGTIVERDKNGRTASVTTPHGTTARMDGRGRVSSIRDQAGNTISRGPRGERRVETVRADRSRIVSFARRGGYVERSFDRVGRQYMSRTYVVGGHTYVHVYRGHYYHGLPYYVYVPPYYYAPAYYGWIYNPWPRPVYYRWGWYSSPWYRPYRYYFVPYPVYPYASLWLTDYALAENLRLAYGGDTSDNYRAGNKEPGIVLSAYRPADQTQGDRSAGDSALLKPEVKQMIADEVKSVIAEQQKAASSLSGSSPNNSGGELPPALDANHRVFVVYSVVEAVANGEICSLTSSDVVKRTQDTLNEDNTVSVEILASKRSDCAVGSRVRVQLTDLNDMQNHLREQVNAGMKILSEKQGKDGLPIAPSPDPRAVPEGTAAPDPTAASDLQKQQQEADQTEKEVQQEAPPDSGPNN
jgi:YD repeat-containing protein